MAKCKAKIRNNQLVVKAKLSRGEKIDERELDLFSRKYTRGLLKANRVKKNVIEYNGPVGISIQERLKKPVSKYDFFFIVEQIIALFQQLQSNGLSADKVILDMSSVFINEITKEVKFIYLPLQNIEKAADVIGFIIQIVYATIHIEGEDVDFISRFLPFMQGLGGFDAEEIERYIFNEDAQIVNTIKKHRVGQSGFITDKRDVHYKHYNEVNERETGLLDERETGLLDERETGLLNERETGLLNEQETGLLYEQGVQNIQIHYPSLYRMATQEIVSIGKSVFCIGSRNHNVDYAINDNNAISYSHIEIIIKNQRYFAKDLGSKNHSYINGQILPAHQEVELFDGNILRLANEEFVFNT